MEIGLGAIDSIGQFGLHGIATDDESLRRDFVMRHLESLAGALKQRVNVIGYLYWSLIDNFEWALGTNPRFGLAGIDYNTQQRLPRPYAQDFSRVCRENQLSLALTATPERQDTISSF